MNFDLILLLVLFVLFFTYYFFNRDKFTRQGVVILYKTKVGLKLMDKLASYPRLLNFLSYIILFTSYVGMIFILGYLTYGTYKLIFIPKSQPVIAPLLPGISISPEIPAISFWHFLIGVAIAVVIHEFAHGVYSRFYKIKVKSSGLGFIGPLPVAFVEPDEKKLKTLEAKKQSTVIGAGPFVNIVFAFLILLLFSYVIAPAERAIVDVEGVNLAKVEEGSPANLSGLYSGLIIKEINGIKIVSHQQIIDEIQKSNGETLKIRTNEGDFYVKPNIVDNKPVIGISLGEVKVKMIKGLPQFLLPVLTWINMLFYWLHIINLGLGLINLLPVGPIDGGRMFYVSSQNYIKNKKIAASVFKYITAFCLILGLVNLFPWMVKLFNWLIGLFS